MKRAYIIIKGFFTALGLITFCFIVWFVAVTMWRAPIHQFNLWKLERNFEQIVSSHPDESQLLWHLKKFGNLFRAASNGCDYFVGEFRSATLSQREIVGAYKDIFVDSFDRTERVPVEIYFLDDEETFGRYPWNEWREKMHKSLKTPSSLESEYLVFVAQTDYPPDGDIRCH